MIRSKKFGISGILKPTLSLNLYLIPEPWTKIHEILKSKNVEFFLHFPRYIRYTRKNSVYPDIEIFLWKNPTILSEIVCGDIEYYESGIAPMWTGRRPYGRGHKASD
jgi:hypothetical protein